MDESLVQQIVDELISSLEPLEAQSAALLQFVKDRGIATDNALAPYLEQAANASNVRWRAFRVRTLSLISSAMKTPEKEQKVQAQIEDKGASAKLSKEPPNKENRSPTPENGMATNREARHGTESAAPLTKSNEGNEQAERAKNPDRKDAA